MGHEDSFIHGLGAFLFGHIFYIIAFRVASSKRSAQTLLAHFLPYGLWCVSVVTYMFALGNPGGFLVPLFGYTTFLCLACWSASVYCLDRVAPSEAALPLRIWHKYAPAIGTSLFCSSDMMIALDKFVPLFHSTSTIRMVYMILYYVGQWAIAYSAL